MLAFWSIWLHERQSKYMGSTMGTPCGACKPRSGRGDNPDDDINIHKARILAEEIIPVLDLGDVLATKQGTREYGASLTAAAHRLREITEFGFFHLTGVDSVLPRDLVTERLGATQQLFSESMSPADYMGNRSTWAHGMGTGYVPRGDTPRGAGLPPYNNSVETFIISNHNEAKQNHLEQEKAPASTSEEGSAAMASEALPNPNPGHHTNPIADPNCNRRAHRQAELIYCWNPNSDLTLTLSLTLTCHGSPTTNQSELVTLTAKHLY